MGVSTSRLGEPESVEAPERHRSGLFGPLAASFGFLILAAFGGGPAFADIIFTGNDISHSPDPVIAGSATPVEFSMGVTNSGAASDTNVKVFIDLSGTNLTFQSGSFTGGGSCPAGPITTTVECSLGTITAGNQKTGTMSFLVQADAPDATLTATFETYADTDTSHISEDEGVDVNVSADISVVKSGPAGAIPGQNVAWTVLVTNAGPSNSTGVTVTDTPPAGFGSPTYAGDCAGATCSLGTITPGNSKSATVTFAVPDDYHLTNGVLVGSAYDDIQNSASASATTTDPDSSDNSDSVDTPLTPQADLSVSITNGASSVSAGLQVSYTVTVSKTGPSQVSGVLIDQSNFALGSVLSQVISPNEGTFSASPISPNWFSLDLSGTDSATLTLAGWLSPAVTGANFAPAITVTPQAGITDTNAGNDSGTDSDPINRTGDLRIVKTNSLDGIVPGQQVAYTITAYNEGPSDVVGATVVDNFDATRVSSATWSFTPARELTIFDEKSDGAGGVDGLDGASALASSGDGKHVYVTASADNSIALFTRTVADGSLAYVSRVVDNGSLGLGGATAVALSPNGSNVYVAGQTDNALQVFSRDPATGLLTPGAVHVHGVLPVTAMSGPRGVAVAPDGRHVYVAAATSGTVVTFSRNLSTGALTFVTSVGNGGGVSGMGGARAVAVSPDGRAAIVAGASDNSVVYFDRNPSTGVLTFVNAFTDGSDGDGLAGAAAVAFAPGSDSFYAVGQTDNAVVAFSRDRTGVNPPAWAEKETPAGLVGPTGVVVSPDGKTVFVAAATSGAVVTFNRVLSGPDAYKLDSPLSTANASVSALGMTPAGEQLYTVSSAGDRLTLYNETRGATANVPVGSDLTFSETANLPAQSHVTYVATAIVSGSATGTLVNTATIDEPGTVVNPADPHPPGLCAVNVDNDSCTDSDIIGLEADLTVTKMASPSNATPGGVLTYTVTVSNAGPADVSGVSFSDPDLAGPGVEFTSVSWSCASSPNSACGSPQNGSGDIQHNGNVAIGAGGSVTYTIVAQISPSAVGIACSPGPGNCIYNTASATLPASHVDPTPEFLSATAQTPVGRLADLSIVKTVTTPAGSIDNGQLLEYSIVVTNCGPSDVAGAVVLDTFSGDYLSPTWSCVATNGSCPAGGSGTINVLVDLDGGNPADCSGAGVATFTVSGTVASGDAVTVLNNIAKVNAPNFTVDPATGNNTSSVLVALQAEADLAIIKTDGPSKTTAVPGSQITYSITVLNYGPDDAGQLQVSDLFPPQLRDIEWTCSSDAPARGTLTWLEEQRQGQPTDVDPIEGIEGLQDVYDVAVAPDGQGKFVYATSPTDGAVATFQRDVEGSGLTYLGRLKDGQIQGPATIDGLANAGGLVLSPDGLNLYVVGVSDSLAGAAATFTRNPVSGALTFFEALAEGGLVSGLTGARELAVSPGGENVYITSPTVGSIGIFERDLSASGRLDFLHKLEMGTIPGLAGAEGLAVSPDGEHVYVAGSANGTIVVLARDTGDGTLNPTPVQTITDAVDGGGFLAGAADIVISPAGDFLYAVSRVDDAVSTFTRDTGTGLLTFVSELDEAQVSGLDGARSVVISPDGQHLYVASADSHAVIVLQRNSATGGLNFVEVRRDGVPGDCLQPPTCLANALGGAHAVAVDPLGRSVYVAATGDSALGVFRRAGVPPSFAFGGGSPGADPPAPVVNNENGVIGLDAVSDLAIQGPHLYAVSFEDASVVAFSRDAQTGELTFLERETDGGGVDGLDGATGVAVYDQNVYVVAQSVNSTDNTLVTFTRDTGTGLLTFLSPVHRNDTAGVTGLFGAADVLVSGDGKNVYVVGRTPGSIAVFSRNLISGALTFVESKIANQGGIVGITGAAGVALSSDDRHLYVAASVDDGVAVFARDPLDGTLEEIQVVSGLPELDRAWGIAASREFSGSRNVYVTGHTANSLAVFARNIDDTSDDFGKLTLLETFTDEQDDVDGIAGGHSVVVSPDGKQVYVAGENDDALAVFSRQEVTGGLVFVEARFDGEDGVDGLDQAYSVVVSANNLQAYVAGFGEDSIALFTRTSGSRCTGAGAGSLVDLGVEIAAGGQVEYTVTATIDPAATGQLVNEAYVIVPESITQPLDPPSNVHPAFVCIDNVGTAYPDITTNDGCRDIDQLTPQSDLALTKTDGETIAIPGEELSYTIVIANEGPSNVVGATVSDPLTSVFPAGASWTCVASPSGILSFVGAAFDTLDLADGISGVSGVAISPDGLNVYAASRDEDALAVFAFDGSTGLLTAIEVHRGPGVEGLDGAAAVAISPDGANVYVAGQVDDAVAVFTRNLTPGPNFGRLTFLEAQQAPGVPGIDGPVALALDAAGESLYVAAANSNAVTVFDRNLVTGALTFLEMQQDGVGSVTGLAGASSVAVTADGAYVYATGENASAVVAFARDVNGALTFVESKVDGDGGTEGLGGARGIAISPDDATVYVAGAGESAIAVFTRDVSQGTLTFLQAARDGEDGFDGLAGVGALAITDDAGLGFHLYATGGAEGALTALRRNAADAGRLEFVSVERDGFSGVNGLAGAADVAISPDGRWVITAGTVDDAVAAFSRPTDSSCSGGSDFAQPDILLEDTVNIASGSEIVYIVTGVVDASLCTDYPCTFELENEATVSSPAGNEDLDPADNSDTDTDALSPRGNLSITKTDHVAVIQGLDGAAAVALSPDGANLYAAGAIGDGVVAFARNAGTGALDFLESERDGVAGVDGLNGASAVVVSIDGAHVYAAGSGDNAVVAFERDGADGRLAFLEKKQNGFGGVTGLLGPDGLVLSNDDRHLYVAAANSSSVAIFGRDNDAGSADYGKLAFLGEVRDGVGGVDGLALARALALSPDGAHLYVVGESDNALAAFSRDAGSGLLTFLEKEVDGVDGVAGISGARGVAISPDGKDLYVAGSTANAVAHFTRVSASGDADFGKVAWVSASVDGDGGVDGIQGAAGIVVAPDPAGADPGGQHVYVAGRGEDAVATFARDELTGALTFVSAARQGQSGFDGMVEPAAVALSAAGEQVYVAGAGSGAVVTSARDWDGGGLTGTGELSFVEADGEGDGTAAPGQELTYEIVVSNAGPSTVNDAVVTDIFPGELEDVSWNCITVTPGAVCPPLPGSGDLVREIDLPPGGIVRFEATGTIKPGVTGDIVNTATVTEPDGWIDLDPSNNSATDGDTILGRNADLAISKVACSDPLDCPNTVVTELVPGTRVHYEIRVENLGLSDAEGAAVDDVLPELFSNVAWSCVASPEPGLLAALVDQPVIRDGDNVPDVEPACGPVLPLVNGLDGARAVEATADGLNVYVAGGVDHAVTSFRRDRRNGKLIFVGALVDGGPRYNPACVQVGIIDGLRGASGVVSSPDGAHVYVSAELDDAVSVYTRAVGTGALSFQQFLRDGVGGVNGLGNARGVAISPDGKHLYTAARSDNGVGLFSRSAGNGNLTYLGILVDGAPQAPLTIDGLAGAAAVAISPDGTSVYVTGEVDDAVAVFSRNAASGALTFLEVEKNGLGGVLGLDGARALAVSGDGLHVYVAGALSDAVAVFSRNPADGKLTFLEAETDGVAGVEGLDGASGVRVSADGTNVYVTGEIDNAVATFERHPVTGKLAPRPAVVDGTDGVEGLSGARALAISPDDEHLYAAGDAEDAIALLERRAGSRCPALGFGDLRDTGDITAGGLLVYSVAADLSPSASGTVENIATVTPPDDVVDPDLANNVGSAVVLLTPEVQLTVTKTDFQTDAVPGLPLTYTIEVSNTGPSDLVGAEVEDLFPIAFGGASWSCVATDALAFVEAETNGNGGVVDLDAPYGLAMAPDPDGFFGPETGGQHVYVASRGGQSIDLFSRDAGTGELAFVTSYIDGVVGFDGFGGAGGIAISPDGAHVYATGKTDDAIAVLSRDLVTGVLTPVAVVRDTDAGIDGLDGANVVAISRDGRNVYVGSEDEDAIVIFERDEATGGLTFLTRLKDGFGGLQIGTLDRPTALAVTADGRDLLVGAADGDRLSVFDRDPATGLLTFGQALIDGVDGVDGLDLVQSIAVSSGGQFVYAAGLADDAISIFERDPGSGELTYVGMTKDGIGGVEGLDGVRAIELSPDGLFLFAASYNDDSVVVFRREPLTGELIPIQTASNGDGGVSGLDGARALVIDPTGRDIVVAGEHADAIAVLSRVGQGRCGTLEGVDDLVAIVDLAAGATTTFSVTGTVDAAATGLLENTVTVAMPPDATNGGDTSATDTDNLTPVAGLSIVKSDGVTSVSPGSSTIYLITVANAGPSDAPGSIVTDTLPAGITSASWTCAGSDGGVCAASGSGSINESVDLPVGASVVFALAVTVDISATGTLSNTATVTPAAGVADPVPGDNSSTDNDTLAAEADLELTQTADQSVVQAGEPIVFTLTVSNLGPAMASGITLIDLLPAGVNVTGVVAPDWSCISAPGSITCTLANLDSATSASPVMIEVDASTTPGGYANAATVSSASADPGSGNNTAVWPFTVVVLEPPSVTAFDSVPDSGDGELELMETATVALTEILVEFNEPLFDPAGDSDPEDVTNPANYQLVGAGPNGSFTTPDCQALVGDDIGFAIASVTFDAGTSTAAVAVGDGSGLTDGLYRFEICTDPGVRDLDGNALDGNGDFVPGDNAVHYFRIQLENLVIRPHADFASDLSEWTGVGGLPTDYGVDAAVDSSAFPLSGSYRLQNLSGDSSLALSQCVTVPGGSESLVLSGRVRIDGAGATTVATGIAEAIDGPCFAPNAILGTWETGTVAGSTGGNFQLFAGAVGDYPPASTALRVTFAATDTPGQAMDVRLDRLSVFVALFADGFESGDTSRWSVAP